MDGEWYPVISWLLVAWTCYKIHEFATETKIPVLNWFAVALVVASFYNVVTAAVWILIVAAVVVILNYFISNI